MALNTMYYFAMDKKGSETAIVDKARNKIFPFILYILLYYYREEVFHRLVLRSIKPIHNSLKINKLSNNCTLYFNKK